MHVNVFACVTASVLVASSYQPRSPRQERHVCHKVRTDITHIQRMEETCPHVHVHVRTYIHVHAIADTLPIDITPDSAIPAHTMNVYMRAMAYTYVLPSYIRTHHSFPVNTKQQLFERERDRKMQTNDSVTRWFVL